MGQHESVEYFVVCNFNGFSMDCCGMFMNELSFRELAFG